MCLMDVQADQIQRTPEELEALAKKTEARFRKLIDDMKRPAMELAREDFFEDEHIESAIASAEKRLRQHLRAIRCGYIGIRFVENHPDD